MNTETTITKENFSNLLEMGKSSDKENHVVLLSLLENLDFDKNFVFILIIRKQTNIAFELWKEHCPNVITKLSSTGLDPSKSPTYKDMLRASLEVKAPEEDVQFLLKTLGDEIQTSIKSVGYDFVEKLDITIKLNKHGKTILSSQSQ